MLRNLGKIAGMLRHEYRCMIEMHEDVRMWGAPSECHADVTAGYVERCVALVTDIERVTGYTAKELDRELVNRCSAKFLYESGVMEPLHEALDYLESEEHRRLRRQWSMQSRLV